MNQIPVVSPESVKILKQRAVNMAGQTLSSIARQLDIPVPDNLNKNKGWQGQLIESFLGATASTKAKPDFVELDIELKTLPIDANGNPKESTYVCTVPLNNPDRYDWQSSWLRKKLSRVLWVPIEANPDVPLTDRTIGNAILWEPSESQSLALQQDWEELMEMVHLGQLEKITSHHGKYLQIRPKAANAKSLCPATDEDGDPIMSLPRGFYLRTLFTRMIIEEHYLVEI